MDSIKVGEVFTSHEGCTMKVIKYVNASNIFVMFDDKHQFVKRVASTHLKSGQVKNPYFPSVHGVGFYGVGNHKAWVGGKTSRTYKMWADLIRRCYTDFWQSKPSRNSYRNCTVCDDWHNFQNFAEWVESNDFYNPLFEIDKDLILRGNKHYSPENCALVPQELNTLTVDSAANRGSEPIGVYKDNRNNRYVAKIKVDAKGVNLGSYDCPQKAYYAYVVAKECNVKRMAKKWRGHIDERVYDALMDWTVNP